MTIEELLKLRPEDLSLWCDSRRVGRGQTYYRQGRVRNPQVQGTTLLAKVQGSRLYQVAIEARPETVRASCTCPDITPCKHVVAVLLTWINHPDQFERIAGEPKPLPDRESGWFSEAPPTSVPMTLEKVLSQHGVQDLRTLGRTRGIPLRGTRKVDLVQQLREALASPPAVTAGYALLDEAARQVLQGFLLIAPVLPSQWLQAAAAQWPGVDGTKQVQKALSVLHTTGLIFPVADYYRREVLPEEFIPHLPSAFPGLQEVPGPALPADDIPLPEQTYRVWEYLQQRPVTRRPPRLRSFRERVQSELRGWENDPAEIEAQAQKNATTWGGPELSLLPPPPLLRDEDRAALTGLIGADEARVDFCTRLLFDVGFVEPQGEQVVPRSEPVDAWLQQSPSDRLRALWEGWWQGTSWAEVHDVPGVRLKRSPRYSYTVRQFLTEQRDTRQRVTRWLHGLEVGRWYTWPSFLDAARKFYPNVFLSPREHPPSEDLWWFTGPGGRKLSFASEDGWAQSVGAYLTALFRGPFRAFGVVALLEQGLAPPTPPDTGGEIMATPADTGGEITAFQLTARGAYLLGRAEAPQVVAQGEPRFAVASDLTLTIAPGTLDSRTLATLQRFAEFVDSAPDAYYYRLTPQTVFAALERGEDPAGIAAFLEEHATEDVPAESASLLWEWIGRYGQLRLYPNMTIMEFAHDHLLPELLASTRLGEYILAELSPRAVAVNPDAIETICRELVRKGYTPRREG